MLLSELSNAAQGPNRIATRPKAPTHCRLYTIRLRMSSGSKIMVSTWHPCGDRRESDASPSQAVSVGAQYVYRTIRLTGPGPGRAG
jgi:hypothetical protein